MCSTASLTKPKDLAKIAENAVEFADSESSGSTTKDLLKSLPYPLNIYGSIGPPAKAPTA
jgi:hypothetical protein